MIYSVWDWSKAGYDYYEGPSAVGLGDVPDHATRGNGFGQVPEAVLSMLPAGARPVGQGPWARGRIAVHQREALAGEPAGAASLLGPLLVAAVAAFFLWR